LIEKWSEEGSYLWGTQESIVKFYERGDMGPHQTRGPFLLRPESSPLEHTREGGRESYGSGISAFPIVPGKNRGVCGIACQDRCRRRNNDSTPLPSLKEGKGEYGEGEPETKGGRNFSNSRVRGLGGEVVPRARRRLLTGKSGTGGCPLTAQGMGDRNKRAKKRWLGIGELEGKLVRR